MRQSQSIFLLSHYRQTIKKRPVLLQIFTRVPPLWREKRPKLRYVIAAHAQEKNSTSPSIFFYFGERPFVRPGTSPLLISSNHFFLCGNRDVSPWTYIPGASRSDVRHAAAPVPLTCPARAPASPSVPFHGEPMNFMGSLMKSFQNSPPRTAAILSRLNWTNRISSRSNLRPGKSVSSTSRAVGQRPPFDVSPEYFRVY